jgi:hypothetical protein
MVNSVSALARIISGSSVGYVINVFMFLRLLMRCDLKLQ